MSALLAATRPTRRDMLRHPWRILAAILLIALPVGVGNFLATTAVSESAAISSGSSESSRTTATFEGASCRQNVTGTAWDCDTAVAGDPAPVIEVLEDNVPDGYTVHSEFTLWGSITHGDSEVAATVMQRARGRLPAPGEIWLLQYQMDELGVIIGDTVTVHPDPLHHQDAVPEPVELRVSGTMPGYAALVSDSSVLDPALLTTDESGPVRSTFSLTGPDSFTWEDVLALNEVGFVVQSQDVRENPPPPDQIPVEFRAADQRMPMQTTVLFAIANIASTLLAGVLLLLVISPVFTIATSRMSRIFALMSSQGATPTHICLAVLAYGLGAGVVGATVGSLLGFGGAAVMWMLRYPDWPVTVPWLWLIGLWGTAVIGSTVASLLPAMLASRASISAGVQGASPDRLLRWRAWMAIGPVGLAVTSAALLLLRSFGSAAAITAGASLGTLLLVLLLAASTPALVVGLGRLGSRLPVAPRLALRDAGRQSLRSVPALAAIIAVLTVGVSALVTQASFEARDSHLHESVFATEAVTISSGIQAGGTPEPEAVEDVVSAANAVLGPTRRFDVLGVGTSTPDNELWVDYEPDLTRVEYSRRDWISGPLGQLGTPAVLASEDVLNLFAMDEQQRATAVAALDTPTVLVPVDTEANEVTVVRHHTDPEDGTTTEMHREVLPVTKVLPEQAVTRLLTEDVFDLFGVQPDYVGTLLLPFDSFPPGTQEALDQQFKDATVTVDLSPRRHLPTMLVPATAAALGLGVVIIMSLVLALSWHGARRQYALLDAVGAAPDLPARVSAATAALFAFTGSAVGLVAGYLTAFLVSEPSEVAAGGSVLYLSNAGFISFDGWLVGILLVLTPALAAVIGMLTHRRPKELEYRET